MSDIVYIAIGFCGDVPIHILGVYTDKSMAKEACERYEFETEYESTIIVPKKLNEFSYEML